MINTFDPKSPPVLEKNDDDEKKPVVKRSKPSGIGREGVIKRELSVKCVDLGQAK